MIREGERTFDETKQKMSDFYDIHNDKGHLVTWEDTLSYGVQNMSDNCDRM